jgi:hypothetical protein
MFLDDIIGPKPIKESKKIKGADGKACWDGYRYNGTKNGTDSCVKVKKVKEGAPIPTTPGSIDPGGAVDNFKQQMANNTEIAYQKAMAENAEELNIGDDVIVTGDVQYKGATGVITDFGQDKRFVVVNLYNHGLVSFHSSDVSQNDYDQDEESDEYVDGFYVIVASEDEGVFIGALTQDGGRWKETTVSGNPPYNWGGNFMSYLTPNDIMKHIQKDYSRGYQVAGPFYNDDEVRAYAQNYFDADINEDDWHGTGNEPADAWHLPAGATLGAGGAAPMAESQGLGDTIRQLYQSIYDQGDDALEYLNTSAPLFAQFWDQYEGDLDSMIAELSPKNLARIAKELQAVADQEGLNEYAAGDDNGDGPEDALFHLAKMWFSAPDVATQQRVEQALAKVGWEIGELESEEGGAFVMRIGDEDGDSYIGWSEEELAGGMSEGAPELLKAEMPLVRHIEQELTKIGYKKGTPEFNAYFNDAIKFYRQFGNFGFNKDQGVAEGLTSEPTIKGNKIYYADHVVICDPNVYSPEYMEEMSGSLSPNGSASEHKKELYYMNNDGSWTIKKLKQGVEEGEEQGIDNKYRRAARKMIQVYKTNPSVKAEVDASPEFFRAMVYATGVIANPERLDGTTHYHKLVDELESIFHYGREGVAEATGKPLIRKVTRTAPDGRTYEVYELLSANGVTIKTGMSKETAMSMLKHYRQQYGESAAWQKKSGKNKNGGLNQKGVDSYRREHPGSKLQTAVTTKPSKLKPGSKDAKRRKSFCARMSGVDGPMKKPNGEPTRKALALRKWNCESVEDFNELMMIAESIRKGKK